MTVGDVDRVSPGSKGAASTPLGEGPADVIVHGGRGRLSVSSLRELWRYREVLVAFVSRRLRVKYKQTTAGLAWVVVQPVASAAMFTVFLGRVAQVGSEGVPYFVFALTGMVFWTFFSAAVMQGSDSLVNESGLLRKVYFPRELVPLATVASCMADLVPGLLVLVVALLLAGITPTLTWLAVPLLLVVLLAVSTAGAIFFSALNVYLRDVRQGLPFLLQLGLFASPVVYSYGSLSEDRRALAEILNPLAAIIDGARRTLLHGQWPDWWPLAGALVWSTVLLVGAYAFFKRVERGFADRA